MVRHYRKWTSADFFTMLVVFGIGLAALVLVWNLGLSHYWLQWQFTRKYAAVRHPADTRRVQYYRETGLLIGNGNHCDLFAGELRSFNGSRKALLKAYEKQTYWSPIERANLPVEVLFIDDGKLTAGILYHGDLTIDMPSPTEDMLNDACLSGKNPGQLYLVYIFDPGYPSGMDPRSN